MSETELAKWRQEVKLEIERWRADPNYIPVLDIPAEQRAEFFKIVKESTSE